MKKLIIGGILIILVGCNSLEVKDKICSPNNPYESSYVTTNERTFYINNKLRCQ